MARHALLLLALAAALAVAAASAYARAADEDLIVGDGDDVLGLGGGRRRLDDLTNNGTSTDAAANATSVDVVPAMSSGFISYAALSRDSVPCSQRGASYYNCQPGAEANPYSRGCSAITQCRG